MRVTQQLPQIAASDLRQPNKHRRVRRIVVSDVVDVGVLSKQLRALFEVDTHDDAICFGGFVCRNACEELSPQLQGRGSVRGAIHDIR